MVPALHVVLPPQRVQAGTGPASVAASQRQGNQAAGVVGTVHMLGNAHAPEDNRVFGLRVGTGHFPNRVGIDAAYGAHHFRGHAFDTCR